MDDDGKPKKKKKKKAKKEEIKMYPKHEYGYPVIGKFQKKNDEDIGTVFQENPENITLSYFERPNITSNTTEFHASL